MDPPVTFGHGPLRDDGLLMPRTFLRVALALAVLCAIAGPALGQKTACSGTMFRPAKDISRLGWDAAGLKRIESHVRDIGSAAFMIVTDGRTVLSVGDLSRNYETHSMRKSLVSALYGIAVENGQISLQTNLKDLQIDDTQALSEVEKSATVLDLLKARSGVYIPAAAETPRARALRPARHSHKPGERWYYNNWDFNVLGEIYQRSTGRSVFTAFDHLIARPLCMQDFDPYQSHYDYQPEFSRYPAYYFRISTRDLARFGQMYLDQGRWGGRQIVPADWVSASTSAVSLTGSKGSDSGYGYMWRVAAIPPEAGAPPIPVGTFTASGWHGHRLTVIPGLRTIIVNRMNTDDPSAPFFEDTEVYDALLRTILAARRSPTPARPTRE
jgi:CubicO group peptidase (beta-lactamase class C family)